jgi:hypothetical protein
MFFLECTIGPSWAVPMDVGGKYSGTVSGMMNMAGNIGGALSPLVFGVLAQFGSWAAPFIVAAGLLVVGSVVWAFWLDPDASVVALKQDLLRVQNAWDESQARRDRDAIYTYLTVVFELVAWWTAENRAPERAQKALRLRHMIPFDNEDPFAAIIRCTADPAKVDKRTRSKWARVLRRALEQKTPSEPLVRFIKRKGGINECAAKFAGHLRRSRQSL